MPRIKRAAIRFIMDLVYHLLSVSQLFTTQIVKNALQREICLDKQNDQTLPRIADNVAAELLIRRIFVNPLKQSANAAQDKPDDKDI